jgi:N-acetylmuramoyl-L-alanine amidase
MRSTLPIIAFGLGLLLLAGAALPRQACAEAAKPAFFKAEAAMKELMDSRDRQKYRENWINAVKQFESVFRIDPDGPWAAASLYRMGILYKGLYRWSRRDADIQEAKDLFERVVRHFPKSAYRKRAIAELNGLDAPAAVAAKPPAPKREDPAVARAFEKAEGCSRRLAANPRRERHRDVWEECIEAYEQVFRKDPDSRYAPASLFKAGTLYLDLHRYSGLKKDRDAGAAHLRRVQSDYARSRYRPMAEARLDGRSVPPGKDGPGGSDPVAALIAKETGKEPEKGSALKGTTSGLAGMRKVSGLRFWSNPSYTRVVIDADDKTPYFHHLLKKDPDLKKPQRLYVDISNARLGKEIPKLIDINDNLLIATRAGQYAPDTVRVVVDIKSFRTYKIFSLMNPFRIIIDVWGDDSTAVAGGGAPAVTAPRGGKVPAGSLAKQLALGVRRIVIDPGHGGKDPGALGYLKGVKEKTITLQIGKRLARKLEARGYEVLMTRTTDTYLTLEERTAFANTRNADLFISIHTNAHRNRSARGVETYILNFATDADAIRVAAMENATSTKNISDLQTILTDLMQNAKIDESGRLASHVQSSIYGTLKTRYSEVKNLGVKQAPFYVLLGAQMPSILVETSFISNPTECKRLVDPGYQDHLADAIIVGVERYIQDLQPTALFRPASGPGS